MERRTFIQFPIALAAMSLNPLPMLRDENRKAFKVEAGKDRYAEELLVMGGKFDCKVSARDTGGDLCIYDTVRMQKGGPALHVHHNQDEWFYVMRGEFIVKVGDDMLNLKPGDSAFAARKIPHAFAKISEGEAQLLILFQPAGTIEDFFLQMSKMGSTIPANQEVIFKKLWLDHGMEIVGPPLRIP
jgi:mannose-6-phosphate isomerase-like protein (cupin superfamily)